MKQSAGDPSKRLEDREIIVSALTTIIEDLLEEEDNEDAIFEDLLALQMRMNNYRLKILEKRLALEKEGTT